MPKTKQINVGLSEDMVKKFNELKKAYFMTSDAELCRMAINRMYAEWKGEREDLRDFIIEEVEPIVEKIMEKKEKERKSD